MSRLNVPNQLLFGGLCRGPRHGRGLRHSGLLLALFVLLLIALAREHGWKQVTPLRVYAAPQATLAYSSYLGGEGVDDIRGITTDNAGNIYVIGETESDDFLGSGWLTSGFSDIFVVKFDASGTNPQYLTFIGSTETDTPISIQADNGGNVYATGLIFADDFPMKNPLWSSPPDFSHNGVLFKLNNTGELVYSTYLPLDVFEAHHNLAVDGVGNAYVTGTTFRDGLSNQIGLLKINPAGTQLLLEEYLGGIDVESGAAVTIDAGGRIYLAGTTSNGESFPVTANALQPVCGDIFYEHNFYCYKDGVMIILNPAGEVLYSSHHGGSFSDEPQAIATDGQGNVLITGNTTSGEFPLANALQATCPLDAALADCRSPRGFVSLIQFNNNVPTLAFSTYLGATEPDSVNVVLDAGIDNNGRATITGYTNGRLFPLHEALQAELTESFCTTFSSQRLCFDAFVTTFNPSGTLAFSTYLGGTFDEFAYAADVSGSGDIYLAGLTEAADFPVTAGAYQPDNQPGDDGFIARISGGAPPPPPGDFNVFVPLVLR